MSIIRAYKSIYATLFHWSVERWRGDEETAAFFSATALTAVLGMNLLLVLGLISLMVAPPQLPHWLWLVVAFFMVGMNYRLFVADRRYLDIARAFRERPATEQARVRLASWLYVLASFIVAFVLIFVAAIVR